MHLTFNGFAWYYFKNPWTASYLLPQRWVHFLTILPPVCQHNNKGLTCRFTQSNVLLPSWSPRAKKGSHCSAAPAAVLQTSRALHYLCISQFQIDFHCKIWVRFSKGESEHMVLLTKYVTVKNIYAVFPHSAVYPQLPIRNQPGSWPSLILAVWHLRILAMYWAPCSSSLFAPFPTQV